MWFLKFECFADPSQITELLSKTIADAHARTCLYSLEHIHNMFRKPQDLSKLMYYKDMVSSYILVLGRHMCQYVCYEFESFIIDWHFIGVQLSPHGFKHGEGYMTLPDCFSQFTSTPQHRLAKVQSCERPIKTTTRYSK